MQEETVKMTVRNVRTGYYYRVAPAAEDAEEPEKSLFERNVLGIPISAVALILGGLVAERRISGSTSVALFLSSLIISKD